MGWTWRWARPMAYAAVAIAGGFLVVRTLIALHESLGGGTAVDYLGMASAARLVAAGSHCVYCPAHLAATQSALLGYTPPPGSAFPIPFVSPAVLAWLLQPLAALPLQTGTDILVLAGVAAMAVAATLLIRYLRPATGMPIASGVVVALVFSLGAATGILLGQIDGILLLCATASLLLLERRHPWWAGILLAPLLLKPQLLWLAVPALLLSSQWRTSVPVLAGGAAVAVGGLLLVGTSHVLDVVGAVGTATYHQLNAQGNTLPELFARPLGSDAAGWVAAAAGAALAVAAMAWQRKRLRAHPAEALAIGLAASVALSPHLGDYSLMLLAVPVVVLARRRPMAGATVAAVFTASTLVPFPGQRVTSLVALTLLASFAWAVRLALAAAAPDRTPATAPRSMVTAHAR